MKFEIQGFGRTQNKYIELDIDFKNFINLMGIRVSIENVDVKDIKEKFKSYIETSKVFRSMIGNEGFQENSIQLFKTEAGVGIVYAGYECEAAYNLILQFLNTLED